MPGADGDHGGGIIPHPTSTHAADRLPAANPNVASADRGPQAGRAGGDPPRNGQRIHAVPNSGSNPEREGRDAPNFTDPAVHDRTRGRVAPVPCGRCRCRSAGRRGPADPLALYGGEIRFDILRDGEKVGRHLVRFAPRADGIEVTSRSEIEVTLLFLTAYRSNYQSIEHWRDGALVGAARGDQRRRRLHQH